MPRLADPHPRPISPIEELLANVCRCGTAKVSRKSFCGPCYFRLPKDLRDNLYRRLGHGYAEAYTRAVIWLREHPEAVAE